MNFLDQTPVLILGLGDSGLAMARWCVRFGAQVSVWDSREHAPHDEVLARELPGVGRLQALPSLQAAEGEGDTANTPRLILKSPGLSPHDPRIAPLLQQARQMGLAVMGELDLFVHALADLKAQRGYEPQVLAITGTNGKTTVTALTALLVARAGRSVVAAGNIGPTLLDTLGEQLDRVPMDATEPMPLEPLEGQDGEAVHEGREPSNEAATPRLPEVWVLELSSFQLAGGGQGVTGFEPTAATVLNITQDHLDWHGDMAAYTAAKAAVLGQHAVWVRNADDPAMAALLPEPVAVAGAGAKKKFGGKATPPPVARSVLRFGLSAPRNPGDFGLVDEAGMTWLVRALPADPTIKRKKGDPEEDLHLQRLMPADALRVRGRHNAANALAALALATAIGCPLAPMLHGLREYRGEPHRMQFVTLVDGIEAYDDSKGTNVGATVAGLQGLGADKAPGRLVVILGGDGKGQDFLPLLAPLQRYARAVATIGRDAERIEHLLAGQGGLALQRFETLPAAVDWCFEQAQEGDAVLLSPACASLDMFDNYSHRAQVFVQAVLSHAADRGQA